MWQIQIFIQLFKKKWSIWLKLKIKESQQPKHLSNCICLSSFEKVMKITFQKKTYKLQNLFIFEKKLEKKIIFQRIWANFGLKTAIFPIFSGKTEYNVWRYVVFVVNSAQYLYSAV